MLVLLATEAFDNWQGAGATATLRISALTTFTTSAGEVIFGQYEPMPWFRDVPCTIGSRVDGAGATLRTLVIPAIELPSTVDSPDNPSARLSFAIKGQSESEFQALPGFEGVLVPADANLTWTELLEYNQLTLAPPVSDWRDVVLQLISENSGGVPDATTTLAGKVRLSAAPSGAPVAISATDPRMQPATTSQTGLLSATDKAKLDPYIHVQNDTSTTWTVVHNWGVQYCSTVTVFTSAGDEVESLITYDSPNHLTIHFPGQFSGIAKVKP